MCNSDNPIMKKKTRLNFKVKGRPVDSKMAAGGNGWFALLWVVCLSLRRASSLLDVSETLVFGPGVQEVTSTLPINYFFIQARDSDGKKLEPNRGSFANYRVSHDYFAMM